LKGEDLIKRIRLSPWATRVFFAWNAATHFIPVDFKKPESSIFLWLVFQKRKQTLKKWTCSNFIDLKAELLLLLEYTPAMTRRRDQGSAFAAEI